jgi:predicted transporter
MSLYHLLKGVDERQAMLMVILVSVGVAIALANLINKMALLMLLSGADFVSVFTKPQLDALALSLLRLHGNGTTIATGFWGLWLFPFGSLVIKSGFLPRALGVPLIVAGCAYLTSSVTSIVLPAYRHVVSQAMMPLYFGEVPIIFWLLIKGAKVPQPQTRSSHAS